MAVISTPLNSSLRIVVTTGKDENGKFIFKNRSFNNLKTGAADEDVMSIASQLADIQEHPVHAIRRTVESELTEVTE
ncbi:MULTISPECIES: DUF1659 domain-containing protein [Tepidanaerobacter]|uniref:DUF1659 domain-containing protein n=1 Tax=Tepidanaerobacter syntrophicus TaxID=224999 RepID=A0A0U9HNL8_9FIRM|nr:MULTISPECIES: DUF1659 domain-containing protein [Tepidanaerobacter]GAQ24583.1 hypothetical protein TSYNT_5430 [Tepidanaerobacter syntrophicus]GLI19841.1 hypothetical protein TSYNTROPHJE_16540 [Tepidanaerobacter syntrophicus]HHV83048.1 DUF1659 domain-containing protein [Tepidanaerobacter syntrophicus]